MIDFKRNNLDMGASPYLQQHKENPINWQEWKSEVLQYARDEDKLIFLSIGYSTCHWCHAMAGEAFQDEEVSRYLNTHFVSIKVDREQRPDIDGYFMEFISEVEGHGGWPLNVFLRPDLSPIFALTYAPVRERYGRPGFIDTLKMVQGMEISYEYTEVEVSDKEEGGPSLGEIMEVLTSYFDKNYGGFGREEKFPPHSTLLFLLSYYDVRKEERFLPLIEKTLDSIALGGLQDHIQGGFFRYCVDRDWEIPHFEKMLYDQALLLWIFSAAYKVLKKQEYKLAADKVISCLEETFQRGSLFYTAQDADTLHREGDTYLWTQEELTQILSAREMEVLRTVYNISQENFHGKIHLTRKTFTLIPSIEKKLLRVRKNRVQPFVDKKILTSWNALTGIGLVMHWRATEDPSSLHKARNLLKELLDQHYRNGDLVHSSLDGKLQKGEFMGDYASLLLFVTYLHEESGGYENLMNRLLDKLLSFKGKRWIESRNPDFKEVGALPYDNPVPSSISIAELAILRAGIFSGRSLNPLNLSVPINCDFHNMVSLFTQGFLKVIEMDSYLSWKELSLNEMQLKV